MVLSIEQDSTSSHTHVEKLLKDTVIGILSILSALSIREMIIETTAMVTPPETRKKLVFLIFVAALVFLVTIVVVTVWR
jgi:hypothetical protein